MGNNLTKHAPFRWLCNLIGDIQFWWQELKLRENIDSEIEKVEGYSGHGSMNGFFVYKSFEQEHAERKRLHELRKLQ